MVKLACSRALSYVSGMNVVHSIDRMSNSSGLVGWWFSDRTGGRGPLSGGSIYVQ